MMDRQASPHPASPGQTTPRLTKPNLASPSIAIVTPWFNHEDLAADYFEATLPELEAGDQHLIIDNHSEPPLEFAAYRLSYNAGFAKASNLGLRRSKTDAVLFLNNDIAVEAPGWLSKLRGALAPRVLVGPLRYGAHADVDGMVLPYIDGWCLGGMREDLMRLGGFDATLAEPAYYSDNLLCLEARAAGMTLRDVRPSLRHKENATAGPAVDSSENRARYVARARSILAAAYDFGSCRSNEQGKEQQVAKKIATRWKVVVGTTATTGLVDLSNWAFDVQIGDEKERVEVSGFNAAGTREYLPGTAEQTIEVSFRQDYASSAVHQTIYPKYQGGSVFAVWVQPDLSAGTSATNPWYGGTVASVFSYPVGATLNEAEEITVTFSPGSNGSFAWGTAGTVV